MRPRRRTSSLGIVFTVGLLTMALCGCPLLTKADKDPPPVDAGTTTVSGTGAKNEAQITRYPNETNLGGIPTLIANNNTIVRTFPGAGAQVAVLSKATPCGKMAQYGNAGTLIMWNDPADGQAMMGWVPNTAFQANVNPSTVKPVVVVKDAGPAPAPAPQPGPAPGPQPGPAPGPAPGPSPAPNFGPCPVSCSPINNQCPTGKSVSNGMCRLSCKEAKDCPRGVSCKGGVCTSG